MGVVTAAMYRRRGQVTMDMSSGPVATNRLPGSGRSAERLAAGLVIVVLLAVVKPWSVLGPAEPAARPAGHDLAAVVPAVVTPTAEPAATTAEPLPSAGPGEVVCTPSDWRVVTIDRLGAWTSRSWQPAQPVRATGPLDRTIPFVRLDGRGVLGIGACAAAASGSGSGQAATLVAVWRLDAGPNRASLVNVAPLAPASAGSVASVALARLVRPAPSAAGNEWPAGRYVVAISDDPVDPVASIRWLGLDLGR